MFPRIFAVVPLIVTVAQADAQFTGEYAGDTWTIQAPVGGSAAFSTDGNSLTIVGPDEGATGFIEVLHFITSDATWSFTWTYTSQDPSAGFDLSYYLLNGEPFFISNVSLWSPPVVGRVSVDVKRGDVIGWGIATLDGIFGPGRLVITDFQIPAPGLLPLLGFIGLIQMRRRE